MGGDYWDRGRPDVPGRCGPAGDLEGAGGRIRYPGAVAASEAFFPFSDSVEILARAGVRAVVQPGGSVRDPEVIEAANRLGVAMVFTGKRHFRH